VAEVAAGVAVGKLLVVQAEEVQDRGVQVVEVDLVFDGVVPVIVGGSVLEAFLDSGTGEPHGVTVGVVIAPVGPLCDGGSAEFSPPHDEGVFEEAAGFHVLQQGGDRLIDFEGVACDLCLETK